MSSISHVASVLPIPLQIATKINYLIDLFWWKKSHNKRAQHLLRPETFQLPRLEGGLGIKNACIVSQALLTKTFWRCHHQPHSFFSKILRPKYHKDFPIPEKVSKYSAASFAWKCVVKSTYLLRDGIAWKFGNEKLINIRNDAWILGNKPTFRSFILSNDIKFEDLLLDSSHWNKSIVFKYLQTASSKNICALEVPVDLVDDYIYLKFTEDGRYSTSSSYSFLLHKNLASVAATVSTSVSDFPRDLIWRRLPCQPHSKIFLWKLVHADNIWRLLQFPLSLYAIWKHRNNVIFRDFSVSPDAVIREIDLLCNQQLEFISRIKDKCQSVRQPDELSHNLQSFHHFFRMEVVFNKNKQTGSFKVYQNDHISHEINNSRLLRLLHDSSDPALPILLSTTIRCLKLFLSCNQDWYVNGIV
ncbi:uncharacterized protein LOC141629556 [Silene latifolia]|uniref:uncharacterized protein LOC141629556 n=1 Tax=Silene latifolia TaxID=37657 RepID=UPI003D786D6A